MIYLDLFIAFFKIGLFSIGGGYAAIPLIESIIVENNAWLSSSEWSNLIAIAEMTPGPIALNAATFVGNTVAGFPGAIVATIANVTPSFFIVLTLAYIYKKYQELDIMYYILKNLRPLVVGLIASAALGILINSLKSESLTLSPFYGINILSLILFFLSLFLIYKFKIRTIKLMIIIACLGLAINLLFI